MSLSGSNHLNLMLLSKEKQQLCLKILYYKQHPWSRTSRQKTSTLPSYYLKSFLFCQLIIESYSQSNLETSRTRRKRHCQHCQLRPLNQRWNRSARSFQSLYPCTRRWQTWSTSSSILHRGIRQLTDKNKIPFLSSETLSYLKSGT